jgi:hypothetical protein
MMTAFFGRFPRPVAALALSAGLALSSLAHGEVLFSSGADGLGSLQTALSQGVFTMVSAENGGTATLSSNYAHTGTQSFKFCYANNEAQAAVEVTLAVPQKHVFLEWWELRERAGDFPGANNYDWAGEKVMRIRSAIIDNTGVDYPLGWAANTNGVDSFGTPGLDDGGVLTIFGNSVASNGNDLASYSYAMPRGEWHKFDMEIDLGTVKTNNGAARLWIDGVQRAQGTGITMLPQNDATIGIVWIGGWYSGSAGPNPSPACRYVDDVVIANTPIGQNAEVPKPPAAVLAR